MSVQTLSRVAERHDLPGHNRPGAGSLPSPSGGRRRRQPAWRRLAAVTVGGWLATAGVAVAADVYDFDVRHPVYGDIGTYTDTIERHGGGWRLDTRLRVAVRILGIVLHREAADYTTVWQDGRLVSFRGVTTTNGATVELHGEASGDVFVITTPSGPRVVPGGVIPSTPWVATVGAGTLMSTKTGRLDRVHGIDLGNGVIALHGLDLVARRYELVSDKRQEVWIGKDGVPLRFRSYESGTPIDFELTADALRKLGFSPDPSRVDADRNPPPPGG